MAVISSLFLWLSEVTVAAGGAREKMASKARGVRVGVFTWEDGEQNFSSFFDLAESCCLRGSLPIFVADGRYVFITGAAGSFFLSKNDFCICEETHGVNSYFDAETLFLACHVEK